MMNRLFYSILICVVAISASAQSRAIYVNPAFYSLAKDHKKVAVIPFDVQIGLRPKERAAMTDEQLQDMQHKEGVAAQNALVSWFLKKQNTQGYSVQFQDVNTTNALLLKAGMNIHDLTSHTPDEIAKTLGVDAIMGGLIQTTKPISDGASVAMGVLLGYYGSTNTGNITINLNDSAAGALLWKYDKALSRSLGSNMNQIMDTLMRKASKQFPYGDMETLRDEERKS